MKANSISRRRFLDATGKGLLSVAACSGLCRLACGTTATAPAVTPPFAVCGIYCGACGAFLGGGKAKKAATSRCLGCNSTRKAPSHAAKCEVRHCAHARKQDSCGLCSNYPCDKIKAFFKDQPKYGLREKYLNTVRDQGLPSWLAEQKKRWTCAECQTPFSYDASTCSKCGAKVYSAAQEYAEFKQGKANG